MSGGLIAEEDGVDGSMVVDGIGTGREIRVRDKKAEVVKSSESHVWRMPGLYRRA